MVMAAAIVAAGCAKHPKAAGPVPATSASARDEEEKTIVAKVNDAGITLRALNDMIGRINELNRSASIQATPEETRKRALDQVVLRELALQEAKRQNLQVEQKDIDLAVKQIGGHDQYYDAFLASRHITDAEFRSQIRQSILLQRIFEQEVPRKVTVTDDDVRKEYEREKDRFLVPAVVSVVDVTIPKQDDKSSMNKAKKIRAAIRSDKEKNPRNVIHDTAVTVRDRALAKDKEPALYDAARKLKPGALSGIVQESDGFHIVKLLSYTPERQQPFEEVKEPLAGKLKADGLKKRREAWEQELRNGAKIELTDVPAAK